MFHRPKSDDQATGQTADKSTVTSQAAPAAQPASAPAAYTQTNAAAPAAATTPSTPKIEKDQKPMSATDNNDKSAEIPGTAAAFQRPGVPGPQGARVPGPAYSTSPYAAPTSPAVNPYGAPASTAAASEGRRLVVGQGITLSGEIEHCDTLIVEGTIEAALKGASMLDITETGMFYGTVEINECTIAGRFEGDITVAGRLTVKSTGVIIGSVSYKELAVEAGATVDGKLSPINGTAAAKRPAPKSASKGRDQGNELPFSATAAE